MMRPMIPLWSLQAPIAPIPKKTLSFPGVVSTRRRFGEGPCSFSVADQ